MTHASPLLSFAADQLQIIALLFMAVVYTLKIRWILKFPAGRDFQAGSPEGALRGARYSLFNIAMPGGMASTRQHPLLYAQFVVFHIGVAVSIAMSFVIPYLPALMTPAVVLAFQAVFTLAFAAGCARFLRRLRDPYMRAISTPDDYFSLVLLIVWLGLSFLAAPMSSETSLLAYFFLTAFFLMYVPSSKISHYIYYPFSRWYLGKTMGHRGVFPLYLPR